MTKRKWFESWCVAERAAACAIRNAARQSLLTLQREGEVAGDVETRELRRRRDEARALFQRTMSAMRAPARRAGARPS